MKVNLISAVVMLVALLSPTRSVNACSCAQATPCEAFGSASAVFIGRMLGGTEKYREYIDKGVTVSLEAGKIRFEVVESFKGVSATEVTVIAMNMKGTSCEGMAALARGKTYLVYAGVLQSGDLAIGPCSSTKPVDGAKADLEFLRQLPQPGSGGRLYVSVAVETGAREPTPLPNVTVVIEDEAHTRIEVKTDPGGTFEARGLKPGKYTVTPTLPENYVARDRYQQTRVVEVFDRGCSRAPFWVNVNGRIGGKLTDASGRPAPAYLVLESVGEPRRIFMDHTDDEGLFEVTGVPAGKYLLRVDLKEGEKEIPYYHPGTVDRSEATIINLSTAQKLEGKNFRLPAGLEVVVVHGRVTYSDGRNAADVEVRLLSDHSKNAVLQVDNFYETQTDGLGLFKLKGFKGLAYKILVIDDLHRAIEEQRESGRIESEKFLLVDEIRDMRLVLPLSPRKPQGTNPKPPPKP